MSANWSRVNWSCLSSRFVSSKCVKKRTTRQASSAPLMQSSKASRKPLQLS